MGNDVKVSHQAFIGDAELGDGVIIGAGVVFCNYDDGARHKSIVASRAMVGSGTMLVAPVSVGRNAVIGAGSVITRNVVDGQRVIQRRVPG
jgi:bifunctional UDP-N-acetylglucosamine pyrophosphorylase/glucosamine-1-phosphate N-acetyltransferase